MISFEGDFKAKMQSTTMLLQCVIFTLALNTGNLFIFILNVRFTFPACRQWWCRNTMFVLSQNGSHKRNLMHIYSILLTIGYTTHRQGYKFFSMASYSFIVCNKNDDTNSSWSLGTRFSFISWTTYPHFLQVYFIATHCDQFLIHYLWFILF